MLRWLRIVQIKMRGADERWSCVEVATECFVQLCEVENVVEVRACQIEDCKLWMGRTHTQLVGYTENAQA